MATFPRPYTHFMRVRTLLTFLLAPSTVLLNAGRGNSRWVAGNLGYDLISKDLPVILDFKTMQIVFEAY